MTMIVRILLLLVISTLVSGYRLTEMNYPGDGFYDEEVENDFGSRSDSGRGGGSGSYAPYEKEFTFGAENYGG